MRIAKTILLCLATAAMPVGAANSLPELTLDVKANMGPGCNIRLTIPITSEFPISYSNESGQGGGSVILRHLPKAISQGTMFLGLICYRDDDGTVQRGWARFDSASQAWKPNLDPEEEKQLKGAFHFYPLQAANRSGWAVTVNDINGDESTRHRTLHYCLINPPKAICGHGDVGYLKDGRKGDLTDYALKILRSIEFLPDESSISETIQPTQ